MEQEVQRNNYEVRKTWHRTHPPKYIMAIASRGD